MRESQLSVCLRFVNISRTICNIFLLILRQTFYLHSILFSPAFIYILTVYICAGTTSGQVELVAQNGRLKGRKVKVGFVKIRSFSATTKEEVTKALEAMHR